KKCKKTTKLAKKKKKYVHKHLLVWAVGTEQEDIKSALRDLGEILGKYIKKDFESNEYEYIKQNFLQSACVFLMKREHLLSHTNSFSLALGNYIPFPSYVYVIIIYIHLYT
ncbi:hypothetical protein RFI_29428, partial [Reticulomyxa filosa]